MEKKYISIDIGEQRSNTESSQKRVQFLNGMRWLQRLIRADRRS